MTKDEIMQSITENLFNAKDPLLIMMIGLPASGKSTFTKQIIKHIDKTFMSMRSLLDFRIASTDSFFEEVSKMSGLTYNELFEYKDLYKIAEITMHNMIKYYTETNHSIIWDQTNMSKKTRQKKLSLIPSNYSKVSIYFEEPTDLQDRLSSRPGKTIPSHVLDSMRNTYNPVEMDEGFIFNYTIGTDNNVL